MRVGAVAQDATVEGAQNLLRCQQIWLRIKKMGGGAKFMLGTERNYSCYGTVKDHLKYYSSDVGTQKLNNPSSKV